MLIYFNMYVYIYIYILINHVIYTVIYVYIIYTKNWRMRIHSPNQLQILIISRPLDSWLLPHLVVFRQPPLWKMMDESSVGMMIIPNCFWKVIQNSMVPKHPAAIVYPIMSPLNPIKWHFLVAYLHQSNLKKESKYLTHPTRQSDFQATHDGQHQNSQGTHVPLLTFLPQKTKHDLALTIQNGGWTLTQTIGCQIHRTRIFYQQKVGIYIYNMMVCR